MPIVRQSFSYIFYFDKAGVLRNVEESQGSVRVAISSHKTELPSDHGTELLRQIFHKFGKFPQSVPGGSGPVVKEPSNSPE